MKNARLMFATTALGTMLSLGLAALPAQAAGLTDVQIQAITGLLSSFGADTTTIATVNAVLHGQTPPEGAPSAGFGGMKEGMGSSTSPHAMVGSTTPWMSSTPPPCPPFLHTLGLGSNDGGTDGEVSGLQTTLRSAGLFTGSSTGFFGPATEKAVAQFQRQNNIASGGPSLGTVGPMTRAILGKRCGMNGSSGSGQ